MYRIDIIPSAQKDLDNLEKMFFEQIKDKIDSLKSNPRPSNCSKLTVEEGYRVAPFSLPASISPQFPSHNLLQINKL